MHQNQLLGFVFLLIGGFSMLAALNNWNFFFERRKVQVMLNLIGRSGARLFYGILGLAIFAAGVLALTGIFPLQD